MSYNPITWKNLAGDISEHFSKPLPAVSLGVQRAGIGASFPIHQTSPVYNPFPSVGEAATAVASVAQLAAFNPIVAGVGAALFGAKFIYDGIKRKR